MSAKIRSALAAICRELVTTRGTSCWLLTRPFKHRRQRAGSWTALTWRWFRAWRGYLRAGTMTDQTGRILAQVGFLLVLFAGIWLVASQIAFFRDATSRMIVAGIALAVGGALLIVATRWGHFG